VPLPEVSSSTQGPEPAPPATEPVPGPAVMPHNTLLQILEAVYGQKDDSVHQDITVKLKILRTHEHYKRVAPRDDDDKIIKDALLGTHETWGFSIYSTLRAMHNFKDHLPQVFAKMGYDKDLEYLEGKEVLAKYGLRYEPAAPPENAYEVIRPVSAFSGKRLVFGYGAGSDACSGDRKENDYTIDKNKEAKPDLVANYLSKEFWKELPDQKFAEVFFECRPFDFDTFALQQMSRILKEKGIVRIGYGGVYQWAHKADPQALGDYFKECGFSGFEIRKETYRSQGRLDEHTNLVLIK
jgi:hypothetical protein